MELQIDVDQLNADLPSLEAAFAAKVEAADVYNERVTEAASRSGATAKQIKAVVVALAKQTETEAAEDARDLADLFSLVLSR